MTTKKDIGLVSPDPIHAVIGTGVTVAMTHEEVILGHITNPCAAAHHITEVPAHTATNEIPCKGDLHHAGVFPEITVDPGHAHHTNTTTKHQEDHLLNPTKQTGKPKTRNLNRSPLMIQHPNTIALMSKSVNQMMI